MFNFYYLYKFLQAGEDCFSNMVIISEGLVNIDAKIFSNTDRYDGFTKNAKHCFFYDQSFYFFLIFRKKTML